MGSIEMLLQLNKTFVLLIFKNTTKSVSASEMLDLSLSLFNVNNIGLS